MNQLNHAGHFVAYAAILASEVLKIPVDHELRLGGYGLLACLAIVLFSHAITASLLRKRRDDKDEI